MVFGGCVLGMCLFEVWARSREGGNERETDTPNGVFWTVKGRFWIFGNECKSCIMEEIIWLRVRLRLKMMKNEYK